MFGLVLEKMPLFVLVLLSCIITIIAQGNKGAIQSLKTFSIGARLSNALVSYVKYIYKTFLPLHLSVHYPHPGDSLPVWQIAGAGVFIAVVTCWAIRKARAYPYVAVGWFWFLGTLVPVIGLIQVGGQAMTDRYTYIPHVGLFITFAWGASALCSISRWGRRALPVCAVITLSTLALGTSAEVRHWENGIVLYDNAIRADDRSDLVHNNFGLALFEKGMFDRAAFHYRKALEINPANDDARNNLGNLMADTGNSEEAERHYKKIIQNDPENAVAHYNFGILLIKQNKPKDAYLHFAQAIKIDPDFAKAYNYIGVLLGRRDKFHEAGVFYEKAMNLDPDLAKARKNFEKNKRRLSGDEIL